MSVLINGQPTTQIAVTDRALHYGDGIFETIAVYDTTPRLWQRHMARMQVGCERLRIPMPDIAQLRAEVAQVAAGHTSSVIKIIVSRGSGGRGYRPPAVAEPSRVVLRYPFPAYPESHGKEGIEMRICDTPLGSNPRLAGIKHLNRLEQVLARSEWDDERIAEGLMLDGDGHPVDGTMSNLFLAIDGVLYTPELSRCGVAGVMRAAVIEAARQLSIPLHIQTITLQMLENAHEVFMTNSLFGIWPVKQCAQSHYAVGMLTRRLQAALASMPEWSHA